MYRLKSWFYYLRWHPKILFPVGVVLMLGLTAGGWGLWRHLHRAKPVPAAVVKPQPPPPPPPAKNTKPSPLTGIEVDPVRADRPVSAVIIENHTDARPQSSLAEAGVVYEALAEGGITRFMALYLENTPGTIGPVRSLRTYFQSWSLEYNAPVAHAGGNIDALDLIVPLGMRDMNQFVQGAYFYRTTDRFAPHNLYTSTAKLDQLIQKLGWWGPAGFTPSPRKADDASHPDHPNIHIEYSYNGYQVDYHYDATHNDYTRFLAGAPHIDRNTGGAIKVKNIVVEYMPTSYGTTRIGEQTVGMDTVGKGRAVVFHDGGASEGTWIKAGHRDRTRLLDAVGKDIPLDVGNTWYSIVPIGKTVTY